MPTELHPSLAHVVRQLEAALGSVDGRAVANRARVLFPETAALVDEARAQAPELLRALVEHVAEDARDQLAADLAAADREARTALARQLAKIARSLRR